MAGIKNVIQDVLAKLATIQVTNNDSSLATPHIRVWNNQLKYDEAGQIESFPKPAFFVEIITPLTFEIIGQGYRSSDVGIRIHIIHEYYNDAGGVTYEQDLPVFDLRDQIIILLTYFNPSGCGPMVSVSEEQDTNHTNLYHYIVDFVCNFTDSKGSRLDVGRDVYVASTPPLDLEVDVTPENGGALHSQQFIIQ